MFNYMLLGDGRMPDGQNMKQAHYFADNVVVYNYIGIWKQLEKHERDLAKSLGEIPLISGTGLVPGKWR